MLTDSLVNKYLPDDTRKISSSGEPSPKGDTRTDCTTSRGITRTFQYIHGRHWLATPWQAIEQARPTELPVGVAMRRPSFDNRCFPRDRTPGTVIMARWPRHVWTSIVTYAIIFLLFPALCLLAYAWVQQWIF